MNTFYNAAAGRMLTGGINWTTGTWYMFLMNQYYTYKGVHKFVSDLPVNQIIASQPIGSREVSAEGWAVSPGVKFANLVPSNVNDLVTYLVFANGNLAGSDLIAYFDTMIEIPFTPDGSDWYILGNSGHTGTIQGSSGWFRP